MRAPPVRTAARGNPLPPLPFISRPALSVLHESMRRATPRGAASQQCAIVQSVGDDERPNITLVIIALKTADHKSRLLRVIAPLGVLIPTGIGIRIDKQELG